MVGIEAAQVVVKGKVISAWLNCQLPGKETLLHRTFKLTLAGALTQVNVLVILPGTEVFGGDMVAPAAPTTNKRSTGSAFADEISTIHMVGLMLDMVRMAADGTSAGLPKWNTGVRQKEGGAPAPGGGGNGQVAAKGTVMFDVLSCQLPPNVSLLHNTFNVTLAGGVAHVKVLLILPGTEVFGAEIAAPLPPFIIKRSTGSLVVDSIWTYMVVAFTLAMVSLMPEATSAGIPKWVVNASQ